MRELLVEGAEVSRKFRQGDADIEALRPASFTIHAGDRIALVGPSGSGKSTLVHLIADLDSPTSGTLNWPSLGPRGTLRPRQIGIVFQAPSLISTLSAIENVEVPLRLSNGRVSPREMAASAMESVGLADVADKLPEELSGGQAQRVGLARAIASRPRLILADEPTGQLDRQTTRQLIDALLASLEGTDVALVIATHDPEVAQRMKCVWTMDHGELRVPVAGHIA